MNALYCHSNRNRLLQTTHTVRLLHIYYDSEVFLRLAFTSQKIKFSIEGFFVKCKQISSSARCI